MKLTDSKIKVLKPKEKPYQSPDGNELVLEVKPTGRKIWVMRYRIEGKPKKTTLGEYPYYSLADARQWREECRSKVAKGISPAEEKKEAKAKAKQEAANTVEAFADFWMKEHVEKTNREPRNIRRVLNKDVIPAIGSMKLQDVEPAHIHAITDAIKRRGADTSALLTRNVLKRMYAYAISRGLVSFNPAAAIEARSIAQARSRDVALSPDEIGKLLRGIYTSSMTRSNKLAIHLLVLTMVRKSKHISRSTLNSAIRTLDLDIRDFVIHDFRRTASTHLHEMGFNSDWIEKCLAHEQQGVRGVYNRAQYAEQRKDMLQKWSNFVDAQIDEGKNVIIGRFGKAFTA